MDPVVWVVIAIVAALVIGGVVWMRRMDRRTARLKERFGPEYDRALEQMQDRRRAEAALEAREERRESLEIRPLDPASREGYATRWSDVQERFVDEPAASLKEAHELVILVMQERGYPTEDFEQRAADLSVDHPQLVEDYRAAHVISLWAASGDATTEDLRQGIVRYRSLFAELLENQKPQDLGQAR